MNFKNLNHSTRKWAAALALGFATIFLYLPGSGGAYYYDDYSNLHGLSNIKNFQQFFEFVFDGNAGPLGRPVALLTFALQSSAWPENGTYLLGTNIAIHTCNALLVFALCFQLRSLSSGNNASRKATQEFAFIAAAFWAFAPILASTSLILVQRMTGLSAFFIFLGILCYLHCYLHFKNRPRLQLLAQATTLGLAMSLSALSKENGVLLPSLVFAIEIALLKNNTEIKAYRNTRIIILGFSLVFLLIYLSPISTSWHEINDYRGFSPWERVQGELVILWKYIYLTFLPKIAFFGPFQDQVTIGFPKELVLLSAAAWILVFAAGFLLRNKNPWLWFGVLWFFIGHMLESGPLLLEPYFEHRNYIPLFGIATLFAHISIIGITRLGNSFRIAIYGYLAILASILLMLTSLWGKPLDAADFWVETNPGSVRAVVHQVNLSLSHNSLDLTENNMDTIQINRMIGGIKLLDKTMQWCKECLGIHMQALAYSCIVEEPEKKRLRLVNIHELLAQPKVSIDITAVDGTAAIASLIANERCPTIHYADMEEILYSMLKHENHATTQGASARIYYQLATIAYAEHRYKDAEEIISKADAKWPNAQPVIDFRIEYYMKHRSGNTASQYIQSKIAQQQRNEINLPRSYLIDLEKKLRELENNEN